MSLTMYGESGFTYAGILATIDLFAHLDRLELTRLAGAVEPVDAPAGTTLCQKGDEADGIYVVMRGSLGVYSSSADGEQKQISTLTAADYFGETILLEERPSPHTIRAEERTSLLFLPRARALEIFRLEPNTVRTIEMIQRRREMQQLGESYETEMATNGATPESIRDNNAARGMARTSGLAAVNAAAATDHPPSLLELRAMLPLSAALGLVVLATILGSAHGQAAFLLFLLAGITLWISGLLPMFGVALFLAAGWVIAGIATPGQAMEGFASSNWLFALCVFGLAAAIARSGLLLRVALMLVRRTPSGLVWNAVGLFLTGILLTPLLLLSQGRVALTAPLAVTLADLLHLEDREEAAAFLGLSAWLGSSPLMFVFLNGHPVCLIAWGLLPEQARLRFDWLHWLLAAAPLGIAVSVGSLIGLYLVLRPRAVAAPPRRQLNLQLAVLGPVSRRERLMLVVLAFTLLGWILGPTLGVDASIVAALSLVFALLLGLMERSAVQDVEWGHLVYLGVILGTSEIVAHLGLDRAAAEVISRALSHVEVSPPIVILAIVGLNLLARLFLAQEITVLVLGLALIPAAQVLGLNPWVIVITLLATSSNWFFTTQSTTYLLAHAVTNGRLFSHSQARAFGFVHCAVTVGSLLLMIPYWGWLGLL